MKGDLKLEAVYPYSPEQVWKALTDSDALAEWLMPNNFQACVGQKFQLRMNPAPSFNGIVECEVVELDRPRRLVYTWHGGTQKTLVSFTLQPVRDGTRVVLEHTGFADDGGMMVSSLLSSTWKKKLETSLPATIARLAGASLPMSPSRESGNVAELLERYSRGALGLENALRALADGDVDREPKPGLWSARQIAMHIVDAEIVGAGRLRMLAAEPGAVLKAYRGDVWGEKLGYKNLPLGAALALFRALRTATAEVLRRLPPEAWSNKGIHEESGELTLENLLQAHCEHTENHIQEILALAPALRTAAS